jgi:hypothetical protein
MYLLRKKEDSQAFRNHTTSLVVDLGWLCKKITVTFAIFVAIVLSGRNAIFFVTIK